MIERLKDPETRAGAFLFFVLVACAVSIGAHLAWTSVVKPARAQLTTYTQTP